MKRVGIEASGGYEQAVVAELRRDRFVVVVFQPAQVRAYAWFHLQRAKNDEIDAALIAVCTAAVKKIHAPPDPRLAPFAEQRTMINQIGEDIARLKNRARDCRNEHARQVWKAEIKHSVGLLRQGVEIQALVAAIREHRDLAERLDLIFSVGGTGLPTAVAILVRMPEIGQLTRQQAAALAGLAPYDDDSGNARGKRHIAGGRKRLRGSALYRRPGSIVPLESAELIALYGRLSAAGKGHKVCAGRLRPQAAHLRQCRGGARDPVGA